MSRGRSAGWYVLALLAVANLLHYANRNVVVTMYDELRLLLDTNDAELGLMTTAFMLPHAPATVFFGWLSDRLDRRRVLAAGILVWSLAALLSPLAESVWGLLAGRALLGLGTAACVPVANAMICSRFRAEAKARAVAVFNLGLFLGGVVGTLLGKKAGHPEAFLLLGAPGLGLTFLVASLRLGAEEVDPGESMEARREGIRLSLALVWANRSFRWTLLGATCMAFASGAYLAWFFDFISHVKGAGEGQALVLLGLCLVVGLAGVITGGILSDRLVARYSSGRQLAIAIGVGATVPSAVAVLYLPWGIPFYAVSCLMMFTISWYHAPLAASVDDLVPSHRSGTAQGLYISAMHLLGTAPSAWLVGTLAEDWGLQQALLLPTGAMLLAALAWLVSLPGVRADLVVQR